MSTKCCRLEIPLHAWQADPVIHRAPAGCRVPEFSTRENAYFNEAAAKARATREEVQILIDTDRRPQLHKEHDGRAMT